MNWKRWSLIGLLVLCLLAAGTLPAVQAQEYRFRLDRNVSHVTVRPDGSADIEYWLTFTNDEGAHPIDIVDVGLPNRSYGLIGAQAAFISPDGVESPLRDVRKSEWLDVGVEIHLDEHTIWPGEQGTVYLRINVREMVYGDPSDERYASLRFTPHYYDSANVHGSTALEVHFYFPPGVTSEQTRYHDRAVDEASLVDGRVVFIYRYPDASGSKPYPHGISFPASAVAQVRKTPTATSVPSAGRAATVAAGPGPSQRAPSSTVVSECVGPGLILLLIAGLIAASVSWKERRKLEYQPPKLSVEGVGIKGGLTAVEAAILLERPLHKVLTMILFGLLKKRALRVLSDDPLRLEAVRPQPEVKLHGYELSFLAAIQADGSLNERILETLLVRLVKDVNTRMKGFSRRETELHYREIVARAWMQVATADSPEVKSAQFEQGLEWMMMNDTFREQSTRVLGEVPVPMPSWWTYYQPWAALEQDAPLPDPAPAAQDARPAASAPAARDPRSTVSAPARESERVPERRDAPEKAPIKLPMLPGAALAGRIVDGIERSASGVVGRLESFTARVGEELRVPAASVVQRARPAPTSPPRDSADFVPPADTSTTSCACACACACAGCACACAGGGR